MLTKDVCYSWETAAKRAEIAGMLALDLPEELLLSFLSAIKIDRL